MTRGTFRIYLGAAPGVGKTFAMLNEGRRRKRRGTDVVVAIVETHGRPATAEQVGELEIVPRRTLSYSGASFEEMDVDAVIARAPAVALVDELAHTNVPGSRNEKRWQDVEELLRAGITVISTLNVQHLESVNDVVEQIAGVKQRETIPDRIVRTADQIELVDMAPEAIRRRMAHGNIYPAERIDAALGNYFRQGNLSALRELALLWVADRVDENLASYRERHGIDDPWETRERVVVAVTGSTDGERVIRRAARMAARSRAGLVAVHVSSLQGNAQDRGDLLERQRQLIGELGGIYKEVAGDDVGTALVEAARSVNATQIVLGATRRSRLAALVHGSVINSVIRASGVGVDVHVISREASDETTRPLRPERPAALPPRRVLLGAVAALFGLPLLTLALAGLRDHLGLPSILLLYLVAVVGISALGGLWPALGASVAAFLLANYYFTPPLYGFSIADGDNLVALVVFLVVAGVVSGFVALAARRATEGARARAESEAFSRLAGTAPIPALLESLRRTLGLRSVKVLRRRPGGWSVDAFAGDDEPGGAIDVRVPLGESHELVAQGPALSTGDRRILDAFAAEIAASIDADELTQAASGMAALAASMDARTALLAAAGTALHELASPATDRAGARLARIGADLAELGRLGRGDPEPAQDVDVAGVVGAALADTSVDTSAVDSEPADGLPGVTVVPELIRRALVEALADSLAVTPAGRRVRIVAGAVPEGVDLRVVDRRPRSGTSAPAPALEGLLARELAVAGNALVETEDTPGGGSTLVLRLPLHLRTPSR